MAIPNPGTETGTTLGSKPGLAIDRKEARPTAAGRDAMTLLIVVLALVLFVGTGSRALIQSAHSIVTGQGPIDPLLANALFLNVALVIFGYRRYVELTREVGERRRAEETANWLAQTDPLTGCLNRRSLMPATAALIEQARGLGQHVAVMMIDLDRFKGINDSYGHRTGDAVLSEVVTRLRGLLPAEVPLARLGGDEFACAIPIVDASEHSIDALANRIIERVAEPIAIDGITLNTGASIGVASTIVGNAGEVSPDADELLHRADLAMYQAKKYGRSRYFWFEKQMAREMRFRNEIEREIRDGIEHDEFVPFYEKQIDLETGRITGFEMLARWNSPRHGLMAPEAFISIAEEIGVIAALSERLIKQAVRDARDWGADITLSVNISPVQLRDPWFAEKLLKIMLEANFPPSRMEIEITETSLHENIGVVRALMTSLRNQGVQISLDDFGTGYSSLSQLRSLPFDRIKIDRSFVATLEDNADSATIIGAITSLGEGMGLPITAEGIESTEVVAALRQYGAFKGQGYLYGRPADADTVRLWLAEDVIAPARKPAPAPAGGGRAKHARG
jgi:diguanylate cyclase (GGDEF)-like protein